MLDSRQASVATAVKECRILAGKKTPSKADTTPTQQQWLEFESPSLRVSNVANAQHAADYLGQDLVDLIKQPHDPPDVCFMYTLFVYNKCVVVTNHNH